MPNDHCDFCSEVEEQKTPLAKNLNGASCFVRGGHDQPTEFVVTKPGTALVSSEIALVATGSPCGSPRGDLTSLHHSAILIHPPGYARDFPAFPC